MASTGKGDDYSTPQPACCKGFGLTTDASVKAYIKDVKQVFSKWGKLTPTERRNELVSAANKQLTATGAPPIGSMQTDLGTRNGEFRSRDWLMALNDKLLNKSSLTIAEQQSLADTVLHETRHAEQFYGIARYQAAQGKNVSMLGIKPSVVVQAKANPMDLKSSQAKCIGGMSDSLYGKGAASRNATLKSMYRTSAINADAMAAYKKLSADPKISTSEKAAAYKSWQDAYAEFEKDYKAYRSLPEEADAWATGGKVPKLW